MLQCYSGITTCLLDKTPDMSSIGHLAGFRRATRGSVPKSFFSHYSAVTEVGKLKKASASRCFFRPVLQPSTSNFSSDRDHMDFGERLALLGIHKREAETDRRSRAHGLQTVKRNPGGSLTCFSVCRWQNEHSPGQDQQPRMLRLQLE